MDLGGKTNHQMNHINCVVVQIAPEKKIKRRIGMRTTMAIGLCTICSGQNGVITSNIITHVS